MMFGLGGSEVLVILFVIILLFGGKRMPELLRNVGAGLRQFSEARKDLEEPFQEVKQAIAESSGLPATTPSRRRPRRRRRIV